MNKQQIEFHKIRNKARHAQASEALNKFFAKCIEEIREVEPTYTQPGTPDRDTRYTYDYIAARYARLGDYWTRLSISGHSNIAVVSFEVVYSVVDIDKAETVEVTQKRFEQYIMRRVEAA